LILLDTNVVSALLMPGSAPAVDIWLDDQDIQSLYLSTATAHELLYGVNLVPEGKLRAAMDLHLDHLFDVVFKSRILPFNLEEARHSAAFKVTRAKAGRPVQSLDILIAGTALAHNMTLATRNIKDFDGAGLKLLNPWNPTP
jgi:toxin FitB